MEFNFTKICRICLEINNKMLSVLDSNIRNKLMACAVVEIHQNDGLPKQICKNCTDKLVISFYFKEQCEKSDKLLREYREKSSEGLSKQEDRDVTRQTDNNTSSFIFVDCNPLTDTDSENEPIMVHSPMQLSPSPQQGTNNIQSQNCNSPEAQVNIESNDAQTKQGHASEDIENAPSNVKKIEEPNHSDKTISFEPSCSKVFPKGTVQTKKERKSFTCEICHKSLSCASSFRYHIKKQIYM